jgi:hypothetical protein
VRRSDALALVTLCLVSAAAGYLAGNRDRPKGGLEPLDRRTAPETIEVIRDDNAGESHLAVPIHILAVTDGSNPTVALAEPNRPDATRWIVRLSRGGHTRIYTGEALSR